MIATVVGIGPKMFQSLTERFSDLASIVRASFRELCDVPGIGPSLARRCIDHFDSFDTKAHIEACEQRSIQIVHCTDKQFPAYLRQISDCPLLLYAKGDLKLVGPNVIAIVGTRRASMYGLGQATQIAQGLARQGITIASGLARGIDAAAHRAALASNGKTIAVLGSGLDRVYPKEHIKLSGEIAESGVLLSELPPTSPPRSGSFPRRNRIISGLAQIVLVVEASLRSGAMITARLALEQNRDVMAIPGRVDQIHSKGCHALIRDGAKLVEGIDDVLEEWRPDLAISGQNPGPVAIPADSFVGTDRENMVLGACERSPRDIDEIGRAVSIPVHELLSILAKLESQRMVRRVPGNRIMRM